ncbi:MAG: H(+)/Cl(-) exchange transporter ClcA [Fusobacteria bacterium]|nr:H(+)/Cl(-) exchange transporter ClcA [Fusobacteriota bacterium]
MRQFEKRLKYFVITDKKQYRFLLLFGLLLGVLVGLVGTFFRMAVTWITNNRYEMLNHIHSIPLKVLISIIISIAMIIAAILLVNKYAPEAAGSGIPEIEGALENKRTIRYQRILPVKFFGGLLSLGSGMILGREGPTVQMGGALGKLLGAHYKLKTDLTHILIAAGAGAGLATAFNAPLAGILFVIEEMHKQFKYSFVSMQAVIIACIVSDVILNFLDGNHPVIMMQQFPIIKDSHLWLFVILGCFFGILGIIFNKLLIKTLDLYKSLSKRNFWIVILVVSTLIGVGVALFPEYVWGGETTIPYVLTTSLPVQIILILFIIRFLGVIFCFGSGVPGGVFAPMIALGTIFGCLFGNVLHLLFPLITISPEIFAVAGMSALFTATVGAPITGIVLVTEITMNYSLILPLMVTCFCAASVSYLGKNKPIYEWLLERTLEIDKNKTSKRSSVSEKK